MLALLNALTFPTARFYSILTLLFQTARPVLRCVLLLSSPQQTLPGHIALPPTLGPSIDYAPIQLEPHPALSLSRHETWSLTPSFSLKSQPDCGSQYIYGSAVTLVFGLLVLSVSALLVLLELSDTFQSTQEPVCSHVANIYTSLTGRPYVASQWEAMLPSLDRLSYLPSDSSFGSSFWDEALVCLGIEGM
jgi:hypothetical protein